MIGFDIGGTKCAVSIGVEENGRLTILDERRIATDLSVPPIEMMERLCALAEEMTDTIDAIGISCGGPLNSRTGEILSPPNLPGWDKVPVVSYLKERYHCPVALQNDANACAMAEWRYGAGERCDNMLFLTFGTGLGAGLILNGRLYEGSNGMAGEAGHIRLAPFGPVGYGKAGSFEGFCSGGGLAQLGQTFATEQLQIGKKTSFCQSPEELSSITAKRLAELAREGHGDALEIFRICGEKLGEGLSILIDLFNPDRIVIGSIFTRCQDLLRPSMEPVLKKNTLAQSLEICQILPAVLGEQIGNYAALSVAAQALADANEKV
ncbi:MAG: ROK family protein [Clostridia bacterium]|nr:ROK family protein [Clostridia bacterium]